MSRQDFAPIRDYIAITLTTLLAYARNLALRPPDRQSNPAHALIVRSISRLTLDVSYCSGDARTITIPDMPAL